MYSVFVTCVTIKTELYVCMYNVCVTIKTELYVCIMYVSL